MEMVDIIKKCRFFLRPEERQNYYYSYIVNKLYYWILMCFSYLSVSECARHCSLCYNETECYECTQGFYLNEDGECKRKHLELMK